MENGLVRFLVHAGIALALTIFSFVFFLNSPIGNNDESVAVLISILLFFVGVFFFTVSFDLMQDSDHDKLRVFFCVLGWLVVLLGTLFSTVVLANMKRDAIVELGPWLLAFMTMWTFGSVLAYIFYRIANSLYLPEAVYPFVPLVAFVVSYFLHVLWSALDRAVGGFFYLGTDFLIYALMLGLMIFFKVRSGYGFMLPSFHGGEKRETQYGAGANNYAASGTVKDANAASPALGLLQFEEEEEEEEEEEAPKRSSDFYDFSKAFKKLFWERMRRENGGLSRVNSPNFKLSWKFEGPSISYVESAVLYSVTVSGDVVPNYNCEDEAEEAVEELESEIKDIAESCRREIAGRFTYADSEINVNVNIRIVSN